MPDRPKIAMATAVFWAPSGIFAILSAISRNSCSVGLSWPRASRSETPRVAKARASCFDPRPAASIDTFRNFSPLSNSSVATSARPAAYCSR